MMVMLQEICVFTMDAGDIFFARLFKTKTPASFFTVMVRHDRHAIPLGRSQAISRYILHLFSKNEHISDTKHIMHILHMQEFDNMTCDPHPSCHRCYAGIKEFLRTDLPTAPKSMNIRREEIEHEASGDGLRERGMRGVVEGSVVEWDEDGSNVRAGPNKKVL